MIQYTSRWDRSLMVTADAQTQKQSIPLYVRPVNPPIFSVHFIARHDWS